MRHLILACLFFFAPVPAFAQAAEPAAEQAEHADCQARILALEKQVTELRAQLAQMQNERINREEEWLDYNRLILSLAPERVSAQIEARSAELARKQKTEGEEQGEAVPADVAAIARRARSEGLARSLRALLITEHIDGFRLLEAGELKDGYMGPVVLRSFDERGRAYGSLSADSLRLEGSTSGRTLTIVLERGYTTQAGERLPFPGSEAGVLRSGSHRIVLTGVDPRPWRERLPELFARADPEELIDDGQWSLPLVRHRLNLLLSQEVSTGYYRLSALGGVKDGVLRDVQLEQLNEDSGLVRRLLADSMRIIPSSESVQLELLDGVQLRGDRRLPFLDGRYRIFLPRVKVSDWSGSGLPGCGQKVGAEEEQEQGQESP